MKETKNLRKLVTRELKAECKKVTALMFDEKKPKKVSEKAEALAELIPSFDCHGSTVVKVLEILIGESLPVVGAKSDIRKGACIVAIKNLTSHDYKIGEPILISATTNHDCRCVTLSGQVYNHIQPAEFRRATTKEINHFFDSIKKLTALI